MTISSSNDGDDRWPTLNPAPPLVSTPHAVDLELKPWELYSLEGAEEPESLEAMKQYFTRYRATKNKGTSHAYTHDALQHSWCAFIRRWNATLREGRPFVSWIEAREERRDEHSVTDLRICVMAEREWRLCYVHLVEGCENCGATRVCPTRDEWERQVRTWPLSEDERRWIGRYERSRSDLEQARLRRGCERSRSRDHHASRGRNRHDPSSTFRRSRSRDRGWYSAVERERSRSQGRGSPVSRRSSSPVRVWLHTRPQRPGYPASGGYAAPTYPPLANIPAREHDSVSQGRARGFALGSTVQHYREAPARDSYERRDLRFVRRSSAGRQPRQSAGVDHPDGRAEHVDETSRATLRLKQPPVSAASSTQQQPVRSGPAAPVQRVTIEQFRIVMAEVELAESARSRASAAEAVAEESQRDRRALVERLRRLERAAFGAPQTNQSARERQGLGPSRHQRRLHGGSNYESVRGAADGSRGQQLEGKA